MPNKPAIHAHVSDAAHDAWHDFAANNGVSVSAMIEALAPCLKANPSSMTLQDVVMAARKIDAARRRSRGRKKKVE
jgi:hypothetical protein